MDNLRPKYREVFVNNSLGREVLTDLLSSLGFGTTHGPDNPLRIAQHNLAIFILARIGIFAPGTMREVVDSLANITPNQSQEEE